MCDLRPGRLPSGAFPDAPPGGDLAFTRRSIGLTSRCDITAASNHPGAGVRGTHRIRSGTNPQPLTARNRLE